MCELCEMATYIFVFAFCLKLNSQTRKYVHQDKMFAELFSTKWYAFCIFLYKDQEAWGVYVVYKTVIVLGSWRYVVFIRAGCMLIWGKN